MTGRLARIYQATIAVSLGVAFSASDPAWAQSKSGAKIAQGTQTILNQLSSRGMKVTLTTRAEVMRRAGGSLANRSGGGVPGCGENACICTGAECLGDIANACKTDTIHCVPSDDGPVCVCEQE